MPVDQIHFFLTGNIQVGKSTILKTVIDNNEDLKLGGFFTRWINKKGVRNAGLYIFPADRKTLSLIWDISKDENAEAYSVLEEKFPDGKNRILSFESGNYKKKLLSKNIFDETGRQYLKKTKNVDLILMDEVGILEDKSYLFQEELLKVLDGDIPVIGVVRNKPGLLTDAVRKHPKVSLIEVTRENRDTLADFLSAEIQKRR